MGDRLALAAPTAALILIICPNSSTPLQRMRVVLESAATRKMTFPIAGMTAQLFVSRPRIRHSGYDFPRATRFILTGRRKVNVPLFAGPGKKFAARGNRGIDETHVNRTNRDCAACLRLAEGVFGSILLLEIPLLDPDEGLHASISQGMVESGDYTSLRHFWELSFLDKPILFFWAQPVRYAAWG